MKKYAYILNAPEAAPESYRCMFKTEAIEAHVVGTSNMEMVCEISKKLVYSGISEIDLCGDFDEEKADMVRAAVEGKADIRLPVYLQREEGLLEQVDLLNFGFLVLDPTFNREAHHSELTVPECHLRAMGVKDLEDAVTAVKELQGEGFRFFELSRHFDAGLTRSLIDACGGISAIGSVGMYKE